MDIVIKNLDRQGIVSSIKELAENRFAAEVSSIKCLGGGSYGIAYLVHINRPPYKVVLKAYKLDGMQESEAAQLNALRAASDVKLPLVYWTAQNVGEQKFCVLCMEYLEGQNIFQNPKFLFASRQKRQRLAVQVADGLAKIHTVENSKFGFFAKPEFDSWEEFYFSIATEVVGFGKQLFERGEISKKTYDTLMFAHKNFDKVFAQKVHKAVLTHGDLNVLNIMVDKRLNLVGFIDPFNSMWADKQYDLFQLNSITGKRFLLYKAYRQKYSTFNDCDLRCAYYSLFNEVLCAYKSGSVIKFLINKFTKNLNKLFIKFNIV